MLKILTLIVLFSALAMPLLLTRAPRNRGKRSLPMALKILAMVLMPFLPRWLSSLARTTQGPACPRCGMSVGRRLAACPKCGNVMTTVRYKVSPLS